MWCIVQLVIHLVFVVKGRLIEKIHWPISEIVQIEITVQNGLY